MLSLRKFVRKILLVLVSFGLALWCLSYAFVPSPEHVMRIAMGSDRVLLSENGQLLQTIRTDFNKRRLAWYRLDNFSMPMQDAVLQAEDRRFRHHLGFDVVGLARAFSSDLRGHAVQGASTITMQLTDLIQDDVLIHNRSIKKGSMFHKLVQLVRAVLLEVRWNKNEILEAYLNLIHLRGEMQGVPAFSYAYLGRHPLTINANEAAVIASMISSPNQNSASLERRACSLLNRTSPPGPSESVQAVSLTGQRPAAPSNGEPSENCGDVKNVVSAIFQKSPKMPETPGIAPHLARRLFFENKKETTLRSTLDFALQQKVISIMESNLQRLSDKNVHDSSAIVIENKTGKVLAYVGTVSTSESPFVDGVMSYRQAGSSLKPFIYGRALETKTLTAASILMDDPTAISWNGEVYRPANYDRHFNGAVSVREALASSLNVPAVKTVTILGLRQTYEVLESLMLTGLKPADFYGVSMALGAVEVRLDELANAYRMLANGGVWSPLRFSQKDTQAPLAEKRVYSREAAYVISNILSDPNARSIGFGWENPLETPFWTAVKTGTSKDYRDNWCMGYSELYTVGVWAGNFDAQAMEKVSGVTGVGPTWFEIMNELHRSRRSLQPPPPPGIVAKTIRHQWAGRGHVEYFIKGTEPAHEVIEPSYNKRVQFVFPADGSVLIKDPHQDQDRIALFLRFKGEIPAGSQLILDKQTLGPAVSPFKMENPSAGDHEISIHGPDASVLTTIHFTIHGAS